MRRHISFLYTHTVLQAKKVVTTILNFMRDLRGGKISFILGSEFGVVLTQQPSSPLFSWY